VTEGPSRMIPFIFLFFWSHDKLVLRCNRMKREVDDGEG
jgi:hypothetical protein